MSLKLCFNCLKPGHSSKTCRSTRTCRTRRLHHHSSLCIKAHSNSNSSEASNPSPSNSNSTVSQGKSNQSSTSTIVALTIAILKHKHKRTLTNPLLRLTKPTRVKQVVVLKLAVNLQQSIQLT